MLVFDERGKPEYPGKNLSEQRREPTTNSTHIWRRVRESNPGHKYLVIYLSKSSIERNGKTQYLERYFLENEPHIFNKNDEDQVKIDLTDLLKEQREK